MTSWSRLRYRENLEADVVGYEMVPEGDVAPLRDELADPPHLGLQVRQQGPVAVRAERLC